MAIDVIPYFPAVFLLMIAAAARLQQGGWFSPGAFFALIWSVYVWIPLLTIPEAPIWPWGVWWIVISVEVVYLGSILGMATGISWRPQTEKGTNSVIMIPSLKEFVVASSTLGFVLVLFLLFSTGRSIETLFSIKALAKAGHEFSIARYHKGYDIPTAGRLLIAAIYFSAMAGGTFYATYQGRRRRWLAFLPFIPAIGVVVLLTAKSAILVVIILWLAAFSSTRVAINDGCDRIFTFLTMEKTGWVLVILTGFFILVQMSRYGLSGFEGGFFVLSRFRIDYFGHLCAFSTWLEKNIPLREGLSLGALSFTGLFDLLGISTTRYAGLYQDFVVIGAAKQYTNVFTLYRGLIQDFGMIGSLIFLFFFGFIGGMAFNGMRRGILLFQPILIIFYSITLWSHVVNLFLYNTIILAWVIFFFYLLFVKLLAARRANEFAAR